MIAGAVTPLRRCAPAPLKGSHFLPQSPRSKGDQMEYGTVCLRRGEEVDLRRGGFWIYDNEIDWYDDICPVGGIVDVIDSAAALCGAGLFYPPQQNHRPHSHPEPGRGHRPGLFPPEDRSGPGTSASSWAFPTAAGWSSARATASPASRWTNSATISPTRLCLSAWSSGRTPLWKF